MASQNAEAYCVAGNTNKSITKSINFYEELSKCAATICKKKILWKKQFSHNYAFFFSITQYLQSRSRWIHNWKLMNFYQKLFIWCFDRFVNCRLVHQCVKSYNVHICIYLWKSNYCGDVSRKPALSLIFELNEQERNIQFSRCIINQDLIIIL